MDANRYFEQMHQVMSAQKRDFSLILSVKVQDLGGCGLALSIAPIEMQQSALHHAFSSVYWTVFTTCRMCSAFQSQASST